MSRTLRLGIFVVLTLAIFAAAIFWIGARDFRFTSTYQLIAQFPNVGGLTDGADVRVGGLHEGSVDRIDLPDRPDQKVTVVMRLKRKTRSVVKRDSVAAIRTEGLVGDRYVEVSFGSPDAPAAENGETIQSQPPIEIEDLIQKAQSTIGKADSMMDSAQTAAGQVAAITGKINRGTGSVGALVNDKALYEHVNAGATAFQEDMEALKHNFLVRGFFKKRGYEDTEDLTAHEIPKLPQKPLAKQFELDPHKLFDKPDTAKLKHEKLLNEVGNYLAQNPFALAVIAASQEKGETDKAKVLTEARAAVVRQYLADNFKLDDTRVKTIGLGKAEQGDRLEVLVYK